MWRPDCLLLSMQSLALLTLFLTSVRCLDKSVAVDIGKDALDNPDIAGHARHSPLTEEHVQGGNHNQEFDHQAVLGSQDLNEEYGQMSPDKAKHQLGLLVDKHDLDGDGYISRDELIEWILHSFRSLDLEESRQKMAQQDPDGDGLVSLEEMLVSSFSYTSKELSKFAKDENRDIQAFMDLVRQDTSRFHAADVDRDGSLDVQEYAAFLHPYNYQFTQDFEVNMTMAMHDKNGDYKLDLNEYMGDKEKNRETRIVDSENFKSYDFNGDGMLDLVEIRGWVLPDNEGIAEGETRHLMSETDHDNDGKLTKEEILRKHELWVGSHAAEEIHMNTEAVLHDPGEL